MASEAVNPKAYPLADAQVRRPARPPDTALPAPKCGF